MIWYKKVLVKYKEEIVTSAIFTIVFSITILLWHFSLGKSFAWVKIEPFSIPNLDNLSFYSALTFRTIGSLLFGLGFYKLLYILLVKILWWRELYRLVKKIIWFLLTVITFELFSKIIELLNCIISFFYNLYALVLYILPSIGITLVIFIFYFFAKKFLKGKKIIE